MQPRLLDVVPLNFHLRPEFDDFHDDYFSSDLTFLGTYVPRKVLLDYRVWWRHTNKVYDIEALVSNGSVRIEPITSEDYRYLLALNQEPHNHLTKESRPPSIVSGRTVISL